jgi:transposase
MDVVVDRCAGLDVHRDSVMATVRVPGTRRRQRERQTRRFGTTVAQLEALGDWLAGFGVTLVGMEATGIYWQPVFGVLEPRLECWLLNAQHLHNVPGRKSDVIDSAWICELVEHGLVRPSFVPPPEIRRPRELTRLRKAEIQERTRTIQRLEKLLQSVGIKLTSVASQAYSVSARAMLEALLTGVSDPNELAELAPGRLRAKIPQLREALANRFELAHHGVLVGQLLAHIDALDHAVATLDERIALATAPYAELIELVSTIPGVKQRTAQVLLAECGADMSVFPTVRHFASWARICPGTNQSAGKQRSGKTLRGSRWLREALTGRPRLPPGRKPPTSPPTTGRSAAAAASRRRSVPSATTSSSPTTTSSATGSPTANSARTGTHAATQPNTEHADSCANSRRSATKSHSRPPPEHLTPNTSQPPTLGPSARPLTRAPPDQQPCRDSHLSLYWPISSTRTGRLSRWESPAASPITSGARPSAGPTGEGSPSWNARTNASHSRT